MKPWLIAAGALVLLISCVMLFTRRHWTYTHPSWDRSFYEIYGQYSIVPCFDVWDMNQRTNCRIRNWGFGIDHGRPFVSWSVWAMDESANWHAISKTKRQ